MVERSTRNKMAEAFIRGIEVGADDPDLAGDGDAMYAAYRKYAAANNPDEFTYWCTTHYWGSFFHDCPYCQDEEER